MDRRSRSVESPRRNRNGGRYRRYSRSRTRSRSRSRERSREHSYRRRDTRSRSRDRQHRRGGSGEKDLYRDIIYDDYQEDKSYSPRRGRDYDRDRDRDYDRDRGDRRDRYSRHGGRRRYNSQDRDSDDSDESYNNHYYNKTPSNTIIVLGLQKHITEADIMSALIQQNMAATSIRLIRKRNTGASRGFAFVEFNSVDEAARWMEITQGGLQLQDQTRAQLQYSHSREQPGKLKLNVSDWYCGKCGVYNFKRRESCFKCYASREESEKGGEGSDEVSNILTKKIMLRNLDALTNEESVLTAMEQVLPELSQKITKILVNRDLLTQTSRGICYLSFESLVDSMNLHNALIALDPPLQIDSREIMVSYCIDHENRQIVPKKGMGGGGDGASMAPMMGPLTASEMAAATSGVSPSSGQYTLADVPRLAEYSASMYASTPAEHAHYLQYYTDYYVSEIRKGDYNNLPSQSQVQETSANSGAAVALSAIQRKQKKMNSIETTATQAAAAAAAAAAAVKATFSAPTMPTPRGNDSKTYPTPDVSLYQYDETSGYYYDPTTGLYYDAHSQYYYNNETGAYLYWDQRRSTYLLATPAAAAQAVSSALQHEAENGAETKASPPAAAAATVEDEVKVKEKKEGSGGSGGGGKGGDKVKVAKKIVKDMEKWAKQLNQKKDYTVVATPQPLLPPKEDVVPSRVPTTASHVSSGYADVGFSILKKKERSKLGDFMSGSAGSATAGGGSSGGGGGSGRIVSSYGSDSEEESLPAVAPASAPLPTAAVGASKGASSEPAEKDYVDFQKLTCLLCKRAFQSLDILQKHLKMSNLHKENLHKFLSARAELDGGDNSASALSYRDRAKERRQKYGECDPPPPNRSRERFEKEMKNLSARGAEGPPMPIGSNNVGNRLLQKMGWSEGQGLGRKNQGRTNIIETEARSSTAGLGNKSGIGPGDDYKTYIKKMMKSRYESV